MPRTCLCALSSIPLRISVFAILLLPNVAIAQSTSQSPTVSIADAAKQNRQKNQQASPANQRTYTNDDVGAGRSAANPSAKPRTPDQVAAHLQELRSKIETLADLHPRELSDPIVHEIQFPGRDQWEQKLYSEKQRFVDCGRSIADVIAKVHGATTEEERKAALTAANELVAQLDTENSLLEHLEAEGIKKAAEWEHH